MKNNIVYKPIEEIKCFKNNPRVHSDEQIKLISNSIKEFGFINPIIIDKNDNIIAGHGRYEAAIELKLSEMPTIKINNFTEHQIELYRIVDNRLNELSEWDETKIEKILSEIDFIDLGVLDKGFFEKIELEELLEEEKISINPYNKIHILLSFSPDKFNKVKDILSEVIKIQGVEYEQGAN